MARESDFVLKTAFATLLVYEIDIISPHHSGPKHMTVRTLVTHAGDYFVRPLLHLLTYVRLRNICRCVIGISVKKSLRESPAGYPM